MALAKEEKAMTRIKGIKARRKTALPQILSPYQGDLKYLVIDDIPWLVDMVKRMRELIKEMTFQGQNHVWQKQANTLLAELENKS